MTPEGRRWEAGAEAMGDGALLDWLKLYWRTILILVALEKNVSVIATVAVLRSDWQAQWNILVRILKHQNAHNYGLWHKLSNCTIQRSKLRMSQVFPVTGQKRFNPAERPIFPQSTVEQPAASSWASWGWTVRTAGGMESLSSLVPLILHANMHTDRTPINQQSTCTGRSTCRHIPLL